ncbi:MAG: hypothetical protein QW215_06580, partial [Ignisphaera sp.]
MSTPSKMRTMLVVLVVIIIVLAALSGYFAIRLVSAPTVTVTVGIGAPGGKKLTVFFFDPAPANPWWDILAKGVEDAVNELKILGVDVDYRRFDATALDVQISQLQQAISLRPDIAV